MLRTAPRERTNTYLVHAKEAVSASPRLPYVDDVTDIQAQGHAVLEIVHGDIGGEGGAENVVVPFEFAAARQSDWICCLHWIESGSIVYLCCHNVQYVRINQKVLTLLFSEWRRRDRSSERQISGWISLLTRNRHRLGDNEIGHLRRWRERAEERGGCGSSVGTPTPSPALSFTSCILAHLRTHTGLYLIQFKAARATCPPLTLPAAPSP